MIIHLIYIYGNIYNKCINRKGILWARLKSDWERF